MQANPFTSSPAFIGRAREIRRIVSRVAGGGQSVAITGEPRMGKTSLLRYLAAGHPAGRIRQPARPSCSAPGRVLGGLRSLASRYESLALVTASRQPLEVLNETTREYSSQGAER